ncbi:MAG TPA: glycosyltransferase [Phycisphaerae bacterium]|nr:glycosyltransferase [Phycisphaerae bacterium]
MHIFWSGFPGPCGGANTECWHTVKMLREAGVEVTMLPTEGAHLAGPLSPRPALESIGCKIIECNAMKLDEVPGLRDSVVVSMCNAWFMRAATAFRERGCRVAWVNCMCAVRDEERVHYNHNGGRGVLDAYVFQSEYQRKQLERTLVNFGYTPDRGHTIRGAFDVAEFPFQPRAHDHREQFVLGRLARGAPDKWSTNWWPICNRIPHPLRVRCMAWHPSVERATGKPPKELAVDLLPSCAEPSQAFLGSLHAMLQINGSVDENWPRTGLEAMAAGVPVVAQRQWGWKEMFRHGETGLLADPRWEYDELPGYVTRLAYDEDYRMEIVHAARKSVVEDLANPENIWPKWRAMLEGLGA